MPNMRKKSNRSKRIVAPKPQRSLKKYILTTLVVSLVIGLVTLLGSHYLTPQTPDINRIAQSQTQDKLDGTFVGLYNDANTGITLANLPRYLDEIGNLDFNTLIIMDLARKNPKSACKDADFKWVTDYKEKLKIIFDYAKANDIEVYVGLLSTWSVCSNAFVTENINSTIPYLKNYAHPDNPITYIQNTYGNHPKFAGWYIPDEPYLGSWPDPSVGNSYWKQYVEAIRAKSSKPILVAPPFYLADQNYTPTQIAARALDFQQQTGVNIQLWQDSVNATGFPVYKSALSQYSTKDYYDAISAAIGKNNLWADIEISNCCVATKGGLAGGGYTGVTAARIKAQLDNAPSSVVSKRIAWIAQYHLTEVNPRGYYGADRALRSYRALFLPSLSQDVLITPLSYKWLSSRHPNYPDSGNELFDRRIGLAKRDSSTNHTDPAYVGLNGSGSLEITLSDEYRISDIGIHFLHQNTVNAHFPSSINVTCSTNNFDWSSPVVLTHPSKQEDSELVIGNSKSKLDLTCRYLRLEFSSNNTLMLISEIELLGSATSAPSSYFVDTPTTHPAYSAIEALRQKNIITGCATDPNRFCPNETVTRSAVPYFLLRGKYGGDFKPPSPANPSFTDVNPSSNYYPWVEYLKTIGVTSGCGKDRYCPSGVLTRAQFAIMLLKTKYGDSYTPPPATGTVFSDIPVSHPQAAWIEALKNQGITSGCSATEYCPNKPITRSQAAIFTRNAFGL